MLLSELTNDLIPILITVLMTNLLLRWEFKRKSKKTRFLPIKKYKIQEKKKENTLSSKKINSRKNDKVKKIRSRPRKRSRKK